MLESLLNFYSWRMKDSSEEEVRVHTLKDHVSGKSVYGMKEKKSKKILREGD